jgi:hypothetical protein
MPPSPPIPVAITDLAAQQDGDAIQLSFTMPGKTVTGDRLASSPTLEFLRGALGSDGSPDAKSFRVVDTIPGSLVVKYLVGGRVKFTDPLAPVKSDSRLGETLVYRVRTRVSPKRASGDSNTVTVRLYPVPERVAGIQTHVTESAVELTWPAPSHTSAGEPLGTIPHYRIWRGELDGTASPSGSTDISQEKFISPLAFLAESAGNTFRDTQFEFGKTYIYIIRSIATLAGKSIESAESDPAVVTPLDTFPPAAPQGLVAAVLPALTPGALLVDLSWSINTESDLAGYRVYRSDRQDTPGHVLNVTLLLTPAIRDNSVQPGHRYWYTVAAVDRAGNESAPSVPLAVEVTQPIP